MAEKNVEIQSGVVTYRQPQLIRDSKGYLYTFYKKSGSTIFCAYSIDGGTSWNEVNSTIAGTYWTAAIDSVDVIHFVYVDSTNTTLYKPFSNFTWGSGETISSATQTNGGGIAIAIDSVDNVHVAWGQFPAADNHDAIYYNKRTAGVWAARTLIYQEPSGTGSNNQSRPSLVISPNGYIYLAWTAVISGVASIQYVRYTSFWTSRVQIGTGNISSDATTSMVADSSNNIHVLWRTTAAEIRYTKYTLLTDSWSLEATIVSTSPTYPTVGIDSSDVLTIVYESNTSPADIYIIQNTGSWGAATKILDATSPDSFTIPQIHTPYFPLFSGVSSERPTTGYHFTFQNTIVGVNILRYYASSDLIFPAPSGKNYSRSAEDDLPLTSANGDILFNPTEYVEVAAEDNTYATQTATNQWCLFIFKDRGIANTEDIHVTWQGKSNVAPSVSTVYLQIYNTNSNTWETMSSDSTSSAGVNFTLVGDITSNQTHYYDASLWVTCRIYQFPD